MTGLNEIDRSRIGRIRVIKVEEEVEDEDEGMLKETEGEGRGGRGEKERGQLSFMFDVLYDAVPNCVYCVKE